MTRLARVRFGWLLGAMDLLLTAPSCGGFYPPEEPEQCAVEPFLHRPFAGEYPVTNVFDHDLPVSWSDHNGVVLAWWGDTVQALDGHMGYDWVMPEGTPLLAAAAGIVTHAGPSSPSYCPPLGRTTTNLVVTILHETPEGERFYVGYSHVSAATVEVGDRVEPGQTLALSGNTGCSTGPHLHFQIEYSAHWEAPTAGGALPVAAEAGVAVDPYGWAGAGTDPWARHAFGAVSQRLWVDGAAPQVGPASH
jgi:murein DD-endopeptidase MepM/ murein hydrolase activator NlpD